MYSIKKIDGEESSTAKGVNMVTELFNKKFVRHKMKRIQSKKHKLETYEIGKISLSCFDNKRYVLEDGIRTLAIFIKIVLQAVKKLEKIVMIEKDCDD